MLIARLIADPATMAMRLEQAKTDLSRYGLSIASHSVLDACDEVIEIALPEGEPGDLAAIFETQFPEADFLIARKPIVVPRLLVSDMDSTMIGQECIDELADYAGLKDQVASITDRAMRGELDFAAALNERVALLGGLPEAAIAACLAERIRPSEGARTLVATLRAHGCRTVLVTGGFHHFADSVGETLGFERVVANTLDVKAGSLSGTVSGELIDSAAKRNVLIEERDRVGEGATTLALGDGANDLPMIVEATYGVAYRAKPALRNAAGGRIESGDLTALLLLLGIARRDWVAA